MSLKLPPPPKQYDPLYESQRNRMIENYINQLYVSGIDVFIHPNARLIMVDEQGHHVEVYVDHNEQVKARHV